VKYEMLKSE